MIAADQPTIFGDDVLVAVSSVEDGNMSFKRGDIDDTLKNREAFLKEVDIDIDDATLVQVTFENVEDFARYETLTDRQKGEGMRSPQSNTIADALVATKPGHAIFLPVADCTVTVIYDPKHHILMVSHLGRQSTVVDGGKKSIVYLQQQFDTNPLDVKVWLGPAVGKESYQLHALDNKGLQEAILEQLHDAGVPEANIEVSSIDTAQSADYFSHSQFVLGNRTTDDRFAVVAAMRVQGKPAS